MGRALVVNFGRSGSRVYLRRSSRVWIAVRAWVTFYSKRARKSIISYASAPRRSYHLTPRMGTDTGVSAAASNEDAGLRGRDGRDYEGRSAAARASIRAPVGRRLA